MLLNTIPTLELFSRLFGPYPFMNEKYAINAHGPAGAIENQTCTSLHPAYMSGDIGFDVLIHELAHQWWGDMVTCDSFHHVWLNEGFAVYSNALWYEATEGFESYQQYMLDQRYWGSGTVYVEDLSNWPIDLSSRIDIQKGFIRSSYAPPCSRRRDFFHGTSQLPPKMRILVRHHRGFTGCHGGGLRKRSRLVLRTVDIR